MFMWVEDIPSKGNEDWEEQLGEQGKLPLCLSTYLWVLHLFLVFNKMGTAPLWNEPFLPASHSYTETTIKMLFLEIPQKA